MKLCIVLSLLLGQCVLSAQSAVPNQRIPERSEITVPCENEGTVTWSKRVDGRREIILKAQHGQDHDHRLDPNHRHRVLANLSLVINNVSVSDSGVYFCNATAVLNLTVTPLKVSLGFSTDGSATGGVGGVERVLFASLAALFFFLTTVE